MWKACRQSGKATEKNVKCNSINWKVAEIRKCLVSFIVLTLLFFLIPNCPPPFLSFVLGGNLEIANDLIDQVVC